MRSPSPPLSIQHVAHTRAGGYGRFSRQACLKGGVETRRAAADFIGQGRTLVNLRSWAESHRDRMIVAVLLTGRLYFERLSPAREQVHELRQKHGKDFEQWREGFFAHTFDCLTQSKTRYLARSPNVDTIRNRPAEAMRKGGMRATRRSRREQKRYVKEREEYFSELFLNGFNGFRDRLKSATSTELDQPA